MTDLRQAMFGGIAMPTIAGVNGGSRKKSARKMKGGIAMPTIANIANTAAPAGGGR